MVNLGSLNPFGSSVKAAAEIVDLYIYPIKSCRGISLKHSNVTTTGLEFDRRWMIVDTTKGNNFETIRENSDLTLVDTAFATSEDPANNGGEDDLELVISIRNQPERRMSIPARPTQEWLAANAKVEQVVIWATKVDGYLLNDKYSNFFVDFLNKPVALVYKGPMVRYAKYNGSPEQLGREQHINYPDVMPILVANTASLDELNGRLKERGANAITYERFRPNIIIRGGETESVAPWSEDKWKTIRIVTGEYQSGYFSSGPSASITFDVCMRCARCQVPNVDPETAVKDKKEPWETLMSYRRVDEGMKFKPCFGMLVAPRSHGEIRVGMRLEIMDTTLDHKINYGRKT